MKTKLKFLIPCLLFVACLDKRKAEDVPPALFGKPKTVALKTGEGYTVNTVTGDSIPVLVNSLGDTVVTGVPIPAKGKVIPPSSITRPKRFSIPPLEQLTRKDAQPKLHQIPEALRVFPVNTDSLTVVPIGGTVQDGRPHILVSSTGDTIKPGVPIPAKGKRVAIVQPQSSPAWPPESKDSATTNMKYLDVDQGMASSSVYSMLEDQRGHLWLGTIDGGEVATTALPLRISWKKKA